MSIVGLTDNPHSSDATVNTAMPARRMRLRPMRSPSRPESRSRPAEGNEVGVDNPGEARLREPEIALNRWQRNVDDGPVEDDHQDSCAKDVKGRPAPVAHARVSNGAWAHARTTSERGRLIPRVWLPPSREVCGFLERSIACRPGVVLRSRGAAMTRMR